MKKIVYNTAPFNMDILRDALEERYGPITEEWKAEMEQESKRRQEEYDRMWYTPSKEKLVEGFPCEIQTSWGWVAGTWPTIQGADSHVALFGGGCTLRAKRKQITI